MRLLYVPDSLAPGGAETSLVEMTPGLVSAGMELHVLPLGPASALRTPLQEAGAVVHQPAERARRITHIRAVMDLARLTRPDLIHTTLFEADVAGRAAARILGFQLRRALSSTLTVRPIRTKRNPSNFMPLLHSIG